MIELSRSKINGYCCLSDPGEPSTGMQRLSVSDAEARILSELVCGRSVIEVGTGLGVATRAMAKTATIVTTLDIDPWVAENVAPGLPEEVVFFKMSAQELLQTFRNKILYDAAFIDGAHDYEAVKADVEACKQMVKVGGLLIFHDMNDPQVVKAVSEHQFEGFFIQTRAMIGVAWNGASDGNKGG